MISSRPWAWGPVGILLPFSRQQESEADLLGLRLMADAGFNPMGALRLWEAMGSQRGADSARQSCSPPTRRPPRASLPCARPYRQRKLAAQAQAAGRSPVCRLL